MKVQGIELAWIVVNDVEKAIKFYTEVVGLHLCEFSKEYGWAELAGPSGSRLGIATASKETDVKAGANAVVTICVDDIDKARAEFSKKKVHLVGDIIEVPGHVKMQTFKDSDGNTFQLCQMLGL